MAIGVAELKRELRAAGGLTEFPEIHQFLDGFYLSRIGIRILIGQHIALHEPQKENHIGAPCSHAPVAGGVVSLARHASSSLNEGSCQVGSQMCLLCAQATWLTRRVLGAQA